VFGKQSASNRHYPLRKLRLLFDENAIPNRSSFIKNFQSALQFDNWRKKPPNENSLPKPHQL